MATLFPRKEERKKKKKKKSETRQSNEETKEKRNSREGISLGVDDGGIPFSEVVRPFLGVVHKYVLPSLDYLMKVEKDIF